MKITLIIISVLVLLYLFLLQRRKWLIKKSHQKTTEIIQARQQEMDNDTNRITREDIREIIVEIPLPEFVLNLFDEKEDLRKYGFYDCFRPAYPLIEGLTQQEQLELNLDRFVFLFETIDDNLEYLVYNKDLKGFSRVHIDKKTPFSDYEVLTWDGSFVGQILTWYEECKTDEEILEMCNLFGLKYGNEILESIKHDLGERYTMEKTNRWIAETIGKINGRIKHKKINEEAM